MARRQPSAKTGAMTNPTPPPSPTGSDPGPAQEGPRVTRHDVFDLGRLRRDTSDSRIAGVASGLARHLDIDPIIVRVALVVLVFFGGAGLLLYVACWVLVPEVGTDARPFGLDDRNRNVALLGVGVFTALAAVGDWAGAFWFPWPLAIVVLLIAWFFSRRDHAGETYNGPAGTMSPTYQGPTASTPPMYYGPPAPTPPMYTPTIQPPPRYVPEPRRRGPVLFWSALALIAIAIGTLGVIDVAGTDVPLPAYPALALAVTGVLLVVGAFWGRAGGLILLGLTLGALTLSSTAITHFDRDELRFAPTRAADVSRSYDLKAGELVLDLSGVRDIDELDGRAIAVDGGLGAIEVIVPAGLNVSVDATAAIGEVDLFGQESGGLVVERHDVLASGNASGDAPTMTLTIDLGLGQVIVREQ